MDAARWEQVQSIFNAALDTPQADRDAFVERECGGDDTLHALVLAMLQEEERGGSLLDRDMSTLANLVLGQPDDALPPQTQFGPYRITRVLGEGGMGVVYLAERDDIGSNAAVKILRDAWLSPARRLRFASEQRTLASLNHPSIARLYDAGTLPDGTPWFVMEYVEGLPLTDCCRARSCTIRERLTLFRAVCDAVLYAHSHAIIHRDLKPSNILVSNDGQVKLLDFGISKQLDTLEDAADRTHTALRLMTPAYAAPEQLRGGAVGVQTDVYSLGVVLYELLAGRTPFDLSRRTPGEAEAIILGRDPERPSTAAHNQAARTGGTEPRASRSEWTDLDVLCLTAMHKDLERRYRSVEALSRDVDNYLNRAPLDARPDSIRYRSAKFLRRNWRSVSAAAVAVTAIVGLAGFYTVRLTTARNAAIAEAARTQRVQHFMLDLFHGGGDAATAPSDSLRVLTLVDRGALEARSLTKDPQVQAELYATLGGIYESLGELNRADTLLDAALTQRRSLRSADSAEIAESMVALGMLRSDQARFDEAERLVRAGLALDKRVLPATHPAIASATASLGVVLENRGSYAEAITVLGQAIQLERVHGDTTPELNETMSELANTHFYLGHYATSDSINRRVLAMSRKLYGDNHPSVANDLINLGAIQFQWEHYKEAEQYYTQALAINVGWYGEDNAEVASDRTMLARALTADSREDEAAALLRRVLTTQERVYGKIHPRVASALNEIGAVALRRKRYDEAADAFSRMIDTYRKVYGDKHYLIGTAMGNLGSVYMAQHDYARAEPLFREAARRYSDAQGPDHVNTGIALAKLGRCLLRQKRYDEASKQSLAAYNVLRKQTDPPESFLEPVCNDLVTEFEALKQPGDADKYRAEVARMAKSGGG